MSPHPALLALEDLLQRVLDTVDAVRSCLRQDSLAPAVPRAGTLTRLKPAEVLQRLRGTVS